MKTLAIFLLMIYAYVVSFFITMGFAMFFLANGMLSGVVIAVQMIALSTMASVPVVQIAKLLYCGYKNFSFKIQNKLYRVVFHCCLILAILVDIFVQIMFFGEWPELLLDPLTLLFIYSPFAMRLIGALSYLVCMLAKLKKDVLTRRTHVI